MVEEEKSPKLVGLNLSNNLLENVRDVTTTDSRLFLNQSTAVEFCGRNYTLEYYLKKMLVHNKQ